MRPWTIKDYATPSKSMLAILSTSLQSYPTVVVHGIASNHDAMKHIVDKLKKMDSNMYIKVAPIGNGYYDSLFMGIEQQLQKLKYQLNKDKELKRGFNLICHSQSALLCRVYIERYSNKVKTFISLAGPHSGFFCGSDEVKCKGYGIQALYEYLTPDSFDGKEVQSMMAPALYFRDPRHGNCPFINTFNNLGPKVTKKFIRRLANLKKFVLVGSDADDKLTPWQSALFGYYDDQFNIVDAENSPEWFTLGLSQMGEKLVQVTMHDMAHYDYLKAENQEWLGDEVYKYLS